MVIGNGYILFVLCSNVEADRIFSISQMIGELFSSKKFHGSCEWNSSIQE